MRICILIPVFNEARTIGSLVESAKAQGFDVVVVDDGSTDTSGLIAQEKGAIVLSHVSKQGKGKSLRDGFAYVLEHKFDAVITMDGDGQHAVEDLKHFLKKAYERPDGIISGNRMSDCPSMPWLRFIVNRFMSWAISRICSQEIPDSQCGFRYISASVLEAVVLQSSEFEIETEVLVRASRHGYRIDAVPIQTIYRDESSKINPWRDTLRFLRFIIKELFVSHPR